MSKIIITIVGQDRVGIVAKTCNYLADHNMNILDITQTILQEYFNMMMIVDISGSKTSFDDMAHELDKLGQEIGVKILCQREEIFKLELRSNARRKKSLPVCTESKQIFSERT